MQREDPLDRLAQRAEEVKTLLPFASRPFVIELAGTPKVWQVNFCRNPGLIFLEEQVSRACLKPNEPPSAQIQMKGHLFFNICGALAQCSQRWCRTLRHPQT